jgi:predicted PurR-regulated permease PerM
MATPIPDEHEATSHRFIVVLVIVAVILSALVIRPFWAAFFVAAVLTATFRPLMERLSKRVRGHRQVAAGIITLGVLLALILPIAGLGTVLVNQAIDAIAWFRRALEYEGVWGLIRRLPAPIEDLARRALAALPDPQQQVQQLAKDQGGTAAAAVGSVLTATGSLVFQTTMRLSAFLFFLTDGRQLIRWVDESLPLRRGQFRELLDEFRRTSRSVLVSTVATAGIQAGTAMVAYLVARVPNAIFLTLLTFLIALIPSVGGAAVVVGVGLVQLATGDTLWGALLIGWGLVVVSLVDNFARPLLLKGGMELHGGIVFFALLGGLAVWGAVGLILGPLVVTFLISVMRLYRRDYGGGRQ